MGVDIKVERKHDSPDKAFLKQQDTHEMLALYFFELDEVAETLKAKKLSDFVDTSDIEDDYYLEIHGDPPPSNWRKNPEEWFETPWAIATLEMLLDHFEEKTPSFISPPDFQSFICDLKDCLELLETIEQENDLFHFSLSI